MNAAYTLDDQRQHLGDPPWSGPAVKRWEEAHGHDCRLPCYPEHGCLVIEDERERLRAENGGLRRDADSQRDRAGLLSRMLSRCDEVREQVVAERDGLRARASELEDGIREIAGMHDGNDTECARCQARALLDTMEGHVDPSGDDAA